MSDEVALQVQQNRQKFPALGQAQLAYVLIEIMPTAALANIQMPINFGFVLDQSGSMDGQKMKDLKAAARLATDQMAPEDIISIVLFDDRVKVLTPAQFATNPDQIKQQIETIASAGGTRISLGLREGLKQLAKNAAPGRVNRLLLLTDGETFGDTQTCEQLALEAGQKDVPVLALGLGESWNMELLDNIAQQSNGLSDFIPQGQPEAILHTFQRSVQTAQQTVVQNATLIMRLIAGVSPRQVWQVVPLINELGHHVVSDRDIQVPLGDLSKNEGQQILVELMVPPRQPGSYRLAQLEVNFDVAAQNLAQQKVKTDVVFEFTANSAEANQPVPEVMNIVEKLTAYKLQNRGMAEAAGGNIISATQKLRAAATRLLDLGENDLAQAAMQEADNLEKQGQMSASGTRKLRYQTRKLTQKLDE
ncbi:MAG: VWA domain-containing protein [Anaerolineae bacterium]